MTQVTSYQKPSEQGYYGDFGGAFIPEMLYGNVEELRSRYLEIMEIRLSARSWICCSGIMQGGPLPYILQTG